MKPEGKVGSPCVMPLDGIRILTLEHFVALPQATKHLAGLGAEVITIESCNRPFGVPATRYTEVGGGIFNDCGRNKLAVSLDLSKPKGIDLFKRLVRVSDVVADNFSPRVMRNFGLDYESLRQIKNDIIVLSFSGFGHKGLWYLYRSYALIAEAASGIANFTGYADGPPQRPGGVPFGDNVPALYAAWSVLLALERRNRTGEGAFIDLSMVEPCIGQVGEAIVRYSLTGQPGVRMGNRDPNAAPSGCYQCQGKDKWVAIAVSSEKQWQALVGVIGNPEWAADKRFQTKQLRIQHQDEIDSHIEEWTRTRNNEAIMKLCQEAGVPAGAALHVREIMTNEHYRYRGTFEVIQQPPPPISAGKRLHLAPPWKLSKTPANTLSPSPMKFGQDTYRVYRELLGLSDRELSDLDAEGVISTVVRKPPGAGASWPATQSVKGMWPIEREYDENYLEILGLQ